MISSSSQTRPLTSGVLPFVDVADQPVAGHRGIDGGRAEQGDAGVCGAGDLTQRRIDDALPQRLDGLLGAELTRQVGKEIRFEPRHGGGRLTGECSTGGFSQMV